jgi:hypothetical protein
VGKASRTKRDSRIKKTCSARAATGAVSLAQAAAAAFLPSIKGARFEFFFNGIRLGGHEAVIACLVEDEFLHLRRLEEGAQAFGRSCLDLLFTHPISGADLDILALAVAFEAKGCIENLTVLAGEHDRYDMLNRHLNDLLSCVDSKIDGTVANFARAHLKEHFTRSKKRGAQNVDALVQHAQAAGFGNAAALLMGEIEAEELADVERRELDKSILRARPARAKAKSL